MRWWKIIYWTVVILALLFGVVTMLTANRAGATTSGISTTANERVAWNDAIGWIDFNPDAVGTVTVSEEKLTGYATSSVGPLSLDCATSPNGNICAQSNYGICNGRLATHNTDGTCSGEDGSGRLSGYAWNDTVGWVSFNCRNHQGLSCTTPYEAWIDSNGTFQGYAWNDTVGWVSFNGPTYAVKTESWRPSSFKGTLDSPIFHAEPGSVLQSVTWHGERNTGFVDFQIAAGVTTTSSWNFIGPDGSASTYYSASCAQSFVGGIDSQNGAIAGVPICINPAQVKNKPYVRYRVRLQSDQAQTQTPRIDDIILNWNAP